MNILLPLWAFANLIVLVVTVVKATKHWIDDDGITFLAMASGANLVIVVVLVCVYFAQIYPAYSSYNGE